MPEGVDISNPDTAYATKDNIVHPASNWGTPEGEAQVEAAEARAEASGVRDPIAREYPDTWRDTPVVSSGSEPFGVVESQHHKSTQEVRDG